MSAKASPERLQRVLELRDAALDVIRHEGTWNAVRNCPSMRITMAEKDGFKFAYQTQFTSRPESSPAHSYEQELLRQRAAPDLPYKLDIWANRKVLSLQWDDSGKINIVSFKPGDWEERLLSP